MPGVYMYLHVHVLKNWIKTFLKTLKKTRPSKITLISKNWSMTSVLSTKLRGIQWLQGNHFSAACGKLHVYFCRPLCMYVCPCKYMSTYVHVWSCFFSIWTNFERMPSNLQFLSLVDIVPDHKRSAWHQSVLFSGLHGHAEWNPAAGKTGLMLLLSPEEAACGNPQGSLGCQSGQMWSVQCRDQNRLWDTSECTWDSPGGQCWI